MQGPLYVGSCNIYVHPTITSFAPPRTKMAPPKPVHQSSVFYPPPWTEEIDHMFIHVLVHEAENGRFLVGGRNPAAVLAAMVEVNRIFGTSFDYKFCAKRFAHLGVRYRLFRWITKLSGVIHDPVTNVIDCSPDAWDFICEKEPLAKAYMLRGEKQFRSLKVLFQKGPDSPELVHNVDEVSIVDLTSHDDSVETDATVVGGVGTCEAACGSGKGKGTNLSGAAVKGKQSVVPGVQEKADNKWWEEVAMGDAHTTSEEEESHSTEVSSTEPLKKREPLDTSKVFGRKLFSDDSSSASFSPMKKA